MYRGYYWLAKKYKRYLLFISVNGKYFRKIYLEDRDIDCFVEYKLIDKYEVLFSDEIIENILNMELRGLRWFLKSEKVSYFYKTIISFISNLKEYKNV